MAIMDGLSAGAGAVIAGGMGLVGGLMQNQQSAANAASAQAFSAEQFATRYQTTVKDMEAAGLNPMLAYSQGGGSPPTGVAAPVTNVGSAAVGAAQEGASAGLAAQQALNQKLITSAQVDNINADTDLKEAQASAVPSQIGANTASAGQANANVGLINANVDKIKSEIPLINQNNLNAQQQNTVLQRTAEMLFQQGNLMFQQGLTQAQQYEVLKATVGKLYSETSLNQLDIDAANNFGNFGRNFQQVKPVIDILRSFIGRGR